MAILIFVVCKIMLTEEESTMCLSTAYRDSKPDEVLMEYVSSIKTEGDTITLTDMMGEQKTFTGILKFADLTGGVLRIDTK